MIIYSIYKYLKRLTTIFIVCFTICTVCYIEDSLGLIKACIENQENQAYKVNLLQLYG